MAHLLLHLILLIIKLLILETHITWLIIPVHFWAYARCLEFSLILFTPDVRSVNDMLVVIFLLLALLFIFDPFLTSHFLKLYSFLLQPLPDLQALFVCLFDFAFLIERSYKSIICANILLILLLIKPSYMTSHNIIFLKILHIRIQNRYDLCLLLLRILHLTLI